MARTVASVAAALLFFLVTWIIAATEPKLLVSAQMAAVLPSYGRAGQGVTATA